MDRDTINRLERAKIRKERAAARTRINEVTPEPPKPITDEELLSNRRRLARDKAAAKVERNKLALVKVKEKTREARKRAKEALVHGFEPEPVRKVWPTVFAPYNPPRRNAVPTILDNLRVVYFNKWTVRFKTPSFNSLYVIDPPLRRFVERLGGKYNTEYELGYVLDLPSLDLQFIIEESMDYELLNLAWMKICDIGRWKRMTSGEFGVSAHDLLAFEDAWRNRRHNGITHLFDSTTVEDLKILFIKLAKKIPDMQEYNMHVHYSRGVMSEPNSETGVMYSLGGPGGFGFDDANQSLVEKINEMKLLACSDKTFNIIFNTYNVHKSNEDRINDIQKKLEGYLTEEKAKEFAQAVSDDPFKGPMTGIVHSMYVSFTWVGNRGKKRLKGAFLPMILDLSVEAHPGIINFTEGLGILNTKSHKVHSTSLCLEDAINFGLKQQHRPTIKVCRSYMKKGFIPATKLTDIAKDLKLYITLARSKDPEDINSKLSNYTIYGDPEHPKIQLYIIMDHYMAFTPSFPFNYGTKKKWSTRTLLATLINKGAIRDMTESELMDYSPKVYDDRNAVRAGIDELKSQVALNVHISEFHEAMTFDELNHAVRNDDDKFLRGVLKNRFPFNGNPYYVCVFDIETYNGYHNTATPYLMKWNILEGIPRMSDEDGVEEFVNANQDLQLVGNYHRFSKNPGMFLAEHIRNLPSMGGEVNVILLAHNAGFDMTCIWNEFGTYTSLLGTYGHPKEVNYMKQYVDYSEELNEGEERKLKRHTYKFRDTACMMGMKLEDMAKAYDLPDNPLASNKLDYPYGIYKEDVCDKLINCAKPILIPFDLLLAHARSEKTLKRTIQLADAWVDKLASRNSRKVVIHRPGTNYVDLRKLALVYCQSDIDILTAAWIKCNDELASNMGMPVHKYFTTPGWSDAYSKQNKSHEGVCKLSGLIGAYCSGTVYGGKCLTRHNTSIYLKAEKPGDGWVYLDGVSLYPSAMFRMNGFPKGAPDIITDNVDEMRELIFGPKPAAFYFITINVMHNPNPTAFPVLSERKEDGGMNYNNNIRGFVHINNYDLEILTMFGFKEGRDYTLVKGIFWNNKSGQIAKVISSLFSSRLLLKAEGNEPGQKNMKLAMNGGFGKNLQKFFQLISKLLIINSVNYEEIIKQVDSKGDNLISYEISEMESVDVLRRNKDGTNFMTQEDRSIVALVFTGDKNDHKNFVHVGSLILSMARLIMAEVYYCIHLLELRDKKAYMFYTDTDSMLIDNAILKELYQLFEETYGRVLEGVNLGEFHSDFEPPTPHDKSYTPRSVESYIVGKKMYSHRVEYKCADSGDLKYYCHNRLKGAPAEVVKRMDTSEYKKLHDANFITFDMTDGGTKLKLRYNKTTRKYQHLNKFSRNVSRTQKLYVAERDEVWGSRYGMELPEDEDDGEVLELVELVELDSK